MVDKTFLHYQVVGELGSGGKSEVEPLCGRELFAVILSEAKNLSIFAPGRLCASPQAKSRAPRGISC
jgi:hypothetical protein